MLKTHQEGINMSDESTNEQPNGITGSIDPQAKQASVAGKYKNAQGQVKVGADGEKEVEVSYKNFKFRKTNSKDSSTKEIDTPVYANKQEKKTDEKGNQIQNQMTRYGNGKVAAVEKQTTQENGETTEESLNTSVAGGFIETKDKKIYRDEDGNQTYNRESETKIGLASKSTKRNNYGQSTENTYRVGTGSAGISYVVEENLKNEKVRGIMLDGGDGKSITITKNQPGSSKPYHVTTKINGQIVTDHDVATIQEAGDEVLNAGIKNVANTKVFQDTVNAAHQA